MFDLSKIFNETLTTVEKAAGEIVGGVIGEKIPSDANRAVSKEPTWYENVLSGIFSGFSATKGGQEVITKTGTATVTSAIKSWTSNPYLWIAIGFIIFILIRKR